MYKSTVKCEEQEMTSSYHAHRKPSVDERRQQGMIKPSPASSSGERQADV